MRIRSLRRKSVIQSLGRREQAGADLRIDRLAEPALLLIPLRVCERPRAIFFDSVLVPDDPKRFLPLAAGRSASSSPAKPAARFVRVSVTSFSIRVLLRLAVGRHTVPLEPAGIDPPRNLGRCTIWTCSGCGKNQSTASGLRTKIDGCFPPEFRLEQNDRTDRVHSLLSCWRDEALGIRRVTKPLRPFGALSQRFGAVLKPAVGVRPSMSVTQHRLKTCACGT